MLFHTTTAVTECSRNCQVHRPVMGTRNGDHAFRELISSEDNRRKLRKRLSMEADQTLPPKLFALAVELQKQLERREQELADENPEQP